MVKRLFRRSLRVPAVATPVTSKKVLNYRRTYLLKGKEESVNQKTLTVPARKGSVL